jgi:TRAP-type mannitol/chloroaromatic compound transport system permease small subunit
MRITMEIARNVRNAIGLASEWSGRIIAWGIIVMVAIVCYEVVMRYFFDAPTVWAFGALGMSLSIFVAMGWAYVAHHRANLTVDIIYKRFSPKTKLILDIIFTLIFFFPLYGTLFYLFAAHAWSTFQAGTTLSPFWGAWYPVVWPYITMVALGFGLLSLQGIVNFAEDVVSLTRVWRMK